MFVIIQGDAVYNNYRNIEMFVIEIHILCVANILQNTLLFIRHI